MTIKTFKNTKCFKIVAVLIVCFFAGQSVIVPGYTQVQPTTLLDLPVPGTMVSTTADFIPSVIKGIKVYPDNPLRFDFIIDTGHSNLQEEAFKEESTRLIKYFLASLTVPEKDLWVNLSPYENERIIPQKFSGTDMGKDLLMQDYLLKQLTASLIYPEKELGSKFWERVYAKAIERYGTMDISVNTFNKVWVVPDKATIYQSGDTAFIIDSHLKVMMDADYLALKSNVDNKALGLDQVKEDEVEDINELSSQIIRELILPEIEKEINQGENFIALRQIYHSMVLATWFKRNLKANILNQVYVGENKINGIDIEDKQVKEKVYQQYLKAFEEGVYNYIKEYNDPVTQEIIPKKYFSGGMEFRQEAIDNAILVEQKSMVETVASANETTSGSLRTVSTVLDPVKNLDRLRRLLNVLAQSNNISEISQNAGEDEILDYVMDYLESQNLVNETRTIGDGVRVYVVSDSVKDSDLGRAIKRWVMDPRGGVKAINYQGTDGTWKIVGFESEIDEQLDLELEEVRQRQTGEHWIVAYNKARQKLRQGDQQIDQQDAQDQYEVARRDTISASIVDAEDINYFQILKRLIGNALGLDSNSQEVEQRALAMLSNEKGLDSGVVVVTRRIVRYVRNVQNEQDVAKFQQTIRLITAAIDNDPTVLQQKGSLTTEQIVAALARISEFSIQDAVQQIQEAGVQREFNPVLQTLGQQIVASATQQRLSQQKPLLQRMTGDAVTPEDQYVRDAELKETYVEMFHTKDRLIAPDREDFDKFQGVYTEVQDVLNRLLEKAGLNAEGYRLYLVDTVEPNASILRHHNTVFVHMGLLRMLSEVGASQDALAWILAHEITHIIQNRREVDEGTVDDSKGFLDSHVEDRAREYQADLEGLRLMDEAGFTVRDAPVFFRTMLAWMSERDIKALAWGTHPDLEERARKLENLIKDYYWSSYVLASTPMNSTLDDIKQRTRYRNFQESVMAVTSADELNDLLTQATTPEELQFAMLIGFEILSDAQQANLPTLQSTFEQRINEFAAEDESRQILYEYMRDEVYAMITRNEGLVRRMEGFRQLAADTSLSTIQRIIDLGIPALFVLGIDVDQLDEQERHKLAKRILTRLSGYSITIGPRDRPEMPSDRFNMYSTGFLGEMLSQFIREIRSATVTLDQARSMVNSLLAMKTEETFSGAVRGDIRINSQLFDLVSAILSSEQYAEALTLEDVQRITSIYERASALGGSYGTQFKTEDAVKELYTVAQRATAPVREVIVSWALSSDVNSALRQQFISRDIQQFAETGTSLFIEGSDRGAYFNLLLQNEYVLKKHTSVFKEFLEQVARDVPNEELVVYHQGILRTFRQEGIRQDAGIFWTLRIDKMRASDEVFNGDVFDEALGEAVSPSIRDMVRSARREIKPLLYTLALGGVVTESDLRRFVFGDQKTRTRPGSMLQNDEIIALIQAGEPTQEIFDSDDLGERFRALDSATRRAIGNRWDELNPQITTNNVMDDEFDLLVRLLETIRVDLGTRMADKDATEQEADYAFGQYVLPIYLQQLYYSIGRDQRLSEEDTTYSPTAWAAFSGEVSMAGTSDRMDRVKGAEQERPRQATRLSSEEMTDSDFVTLFEFLAQLPAEFDAAVDVLVNNLPPSVFRSFALYFLYTDRVLGGQTEFAGRKEDALSLSKIYEHIELLGAENRSIATEGLARIIPHMVFDNLIEESNRTLLAQYVGRRLTRKEQPDEAGIRQEHTEEVSTYEDVLFASLGGPLAQLSIFLGKLAETDLQPLVQARDIALGAKREAILKFYPHSSTVRDRLLQQALKVSSAQASVADVEEVLQLFANQNLRDTLALGVIDRYQSEQPQAFADLESALREIERFFPNPSLIRDDVLNETAQHLAKTPQQFRQVQSLFADPFQRVEDIDEKKEARIIAGHDAFHAIVKKQSAQDKMEFLLWVLGVTNRKPFFLVEAEHTFHVSADSLRDAYALEPSIHYPEAGRSTQREALSPILYGERGILNDEPSMQQFLSEFFDFLVRDGPNKTLMKTIYDAVFEKADTSRREELLLSLIWSLSQQRSELQADTLDSEVQEAKAARYFLEALGLGGKKLAQVLSRMRNVSSVMRDELAQVQDNARRLPKGVIFDLMDKLYGDFFEKFESIEEPAGSASIKVVYRAVLKDGRVVSIKVKRPEIEKQVDQDLSFLRDVLDAIRPQLEVEGYPLPRNLIDQIEKGILDELDFDLEVVNTRKLFDNVVKRSRSRRVVDWVLSKLFDMVVEAPTQDYSLSVPEVIEAANNTLIIEEWMDGSNLAKRDQLAQAGLDPVDLERAAARELLKQIFVDGFYHADPHTGNILIRLEDGRIAFIDAGAAFSISFQNRIRLARLFRAINGNNVNALGRIVRSFGGQVTGEIRQGFQERIIETDEDIAGKILEFFQILEDNNVDVPTQLLDIFRFFGTGGTLFQDIQTEQAQAGTSIDADTVVETDQTDETRHFRGLRLSQARQSLDIQAEVDRRAQSRQLIPGTETRDARTGPLFEMPPNELQEVASALGRNVQEIGALVNQAADLLARWGVDTTPLQGKNILLAMIDAPASQHLFEDHRPNAFIGINRTILNISQRDQKVAEMMFVIGLAHELRHEAGIDEENLDLDVQLANEFMSREQINLADFVEALGEELRDADFVLAVLTSGVSVQSIADVNLEPTEVVQAQRQDVTTEIDLETTRNVETSSDNLGGIDLNPNLLDIETQGEVIELNIPVNPQAIQDIPIEGFNPVILQITPTNLPLLIGSTEGTRKPLELSLAD